MFGNQHPSTATSLNNLAELYQAVGDYAKAEPLFKEVVETSRETLGAEHPVTAVSLINLALLEFDLERVEEASGLTREAAEAQRQVLSKIFSFTSEPQRLAYLSIFNPFTLLALLKGSEVDLAVAVLRYKGVVLDSIVEDLLEAEASQRSEDQKLVEELNLDKRELGQLLLQPAQNLATQTNQRIDALEGKAERIEAQLAQHVAGLGQSRHALAVNLEQVQATIPDDGALVEYLRYRCYLGKNQWEQRYRAIVLFFTGEPLWIPLGQANETEHLVQRYGNLVRGSAQEDELAANLQALYKTLWAPISQALPSRTKRIIISPDGELNFVSFATLLIMTSSSWLKDTMSSTLPADAICYVRSSLQRLEKSFYLRIRTLILFQQQCYPTQTKKCPGCTLKVDAWQRKNGCRRLELRESRQHSERKR